MRKQKYLIFISLIVLLISTITACADAAEPQVFNLVVQETYHWDLINDLGVGTVYISKHPSIADVDSKTGLITAKSVGVTFIIARNGDNILTCKVVVSMPKSPEQQKIDISEAEVELDKQEYEYTGEVITPTVKHVLLKGIVLTKDVDYTVQYKNSVNTGSHSLDIIGKGKYTGTISVPFSIKEEKKPITQATVTLSETEFTYDGEEKRPIVTVKQGETTLTENVDYMLEFSSDLINVGTVTVTVKGIGAYSGEASKTYTITALSIEGATVTLSETEFTYDGEAKTPTVATIEVNGKSYSVILDTDYTIEYSNNISAGTATATITGKGNFTGVVEAHFTIAKLDLSEAEIILNGDEFEFVEGGVQPEVVSVMLNGKELTEGVDYEVDYADNESEGTGKVIITGIGNYEGKAEKTFMIILLEGGGEEEGE